MSLRWSDKTQYGPDFQEHLLEQYKLTVQMADSMSARRSETNQFFLAASAALLSVGVGLLSTSLLGALLSGLLVAFLAVVGVLVSVVWVLTIKTYRSLNSVKFRLINEMESRLPANPYEAEWDILSPRRKVEETRVSHRQLTSLEIMIPYVFMGFFSALVLLAIYKAA